MSNGKFKRGKTTTTATKKEAVMPNNFSFVWRYSDI